MTINVPLLRKTLDHITAHPEEWNQRTWMRKDQSSPCGTVSCLAGHAVVLAGHQVKWRQGCEYSGCVECFAECGPGVVAVVDLGPDQEIGSIQAVAIKELGLTFSQSASLFDYGNTLADLWELANEYTDGEIEVPGLPKAAGRSSSRACAECASA